MQPAKGGYRETIPHDRPDHSITAVFAVAQAVTVLDARAPARDVAGPMSDLIVRADVFAQNVAAPTVVIARDPEDRHSGIVQLRKGRESPKTPARDYRLPFEPEVEEISVDHERRGAPLEAAEKSHEPPLGLHRCDAQMRVRDHVTGGCQHD